MARILIVDDEESVLYSLERALGAEGLSIVTASTAGQGIELVKSEKPDLVIVDVRLPDMSGIDAFDRIRSLDRRLPVIVITAFSATETAIEAMKRGAFDFLLKPLDLVQLRSVVAQALEASRLSRVPTVLGDVEEEEGGDRVVGRCPAMQEVYKSIGRVARQDVTVLILGESGTGKELVARALYQHGKRSEGPFLAINCAAIPEALLESELFGYERGAFTGAFSRRIGKFEQAHGGTVFLDEVGDMAPSTQAKVLRLLQDGSFERVGGKETLQVDVRIIAATNRDLAADVQTGRFRGDLFYRLNVFSIHLPPLRERGDDLPLLVDHFVGRLSRELGKPVEKVAPETMALLASHDWPGNVRELQSALKYAIVQAPGTVLTPDLLPEQLTPGPPSPEGEAKAILDVAELVSRLFESGSVEIHEEAHALLDRMLLEEVLRRVGGSQVEAARVLGIARNTLRARLRALGLRVQKQVSAESSEGTPATE